MPRALQAELVSSLREFSKSSSARVAAGAGAAPRPRKRAVPTSSATVSISSSTQGDGDAGGATGHVADSAATSQLAGGCEASVGSLRRASKRKRLTPVPSVTDLESMERTLLRQQAQQAQQPQQAQQHGLPPLPQRPRPQQQQEQPQEWWPPMSRAAAAAGHDVRPAAAGGGSSWSGHQPWCRAAPPGSDSLEQLQTSSSGVLLWPPSLQQRSPPGAAISSPTHRERSGLAETDPAAGIAMSGTVPQPFIVAQQVQGDAGLAAAAAALSAGLWHTPSYSPLRIQPLQGCPAPIARLPESLAFQERLLLPTVEAGREAGWGVLGSNLLAVGGPLPVPGVGSLQPQAPVQPLLPALPQRPSGAVLRGSGVASSSSSPLHAGLPAALPASQQTCLEGQGILPSAAAAAEAGLPPDAPLLAAQYQLQPAAQPQPLAQTPPTPTAAAAQAAAQPASLPLLSPVVATRAVQELVSIQLAADLLGPKAPP